tara:strand:- start:2402 stop:3229 length:828 start_codon:yes stop_codon:yes gene_type:complete
MKLFSNINFKYVFLIIISTIVIGYILGMTISTVVDYRLKDAVINLPNPINRIFLKLKNKKLINLKRKQKGRKLEIEIEKKNQIIDRSFKKKGKLQKKNSLNLKKNKNLTENTQSNNELNNNNNSSNNTYNVESFDPNDFNDNSPWNSKNTPTQYKNDNKIKSYSGIKGSLFGYNRKSSLGSFPDKLSSTYSQNFKGVDITTRTYSDLFEKSKKKKKGEKKISASNIEDIEQQFQSVKEKIKPSLIQGKEEVRRLSFDEEKKKKRKRKYECKIHTK